MNRRKKAASPSDECFKRKTKKTTGLRILAQIEPSGHRLVTPFLLVNNAMHSGNNFTCI